MEPHQLSSWLLNSSKELTNWSKWTFTLPISLQDLRSLLERHADTLKISYQSQYKVWESKHYWTVLRHQCLQSLSTLTHNSLQIWSSNQSRLLNNNQFSGQNIQLNRSISSRLTVKALQKVNWLRGMPFKQ